MPERPADDFRPLVSILTPSLNQAAWLPDNLRSVARQTYPSIEQIVIDGGSSDDSVGVLHRLAGPHVHWQSEPDRGQSHAINKAFARASGEITGWLNSDDAYFDRRAVEWAVGLFAKRPDVDVVYGHAALVNADGLILQAMWSPPFSYALLRSFNFIIQPTVFLRRRAIAGSALVDEGYESSMDRELWLRLGRQVRFARVPRILAIDRHQPGRKVYTRPDLAARDAENMRRTYRIPGGRTLAGRQKLLKIAFRFVGVSLLHSIQSADLAFNGCRDGYRRLLPRQIATRRASMPIGGDAQPTTDVESAQVSLKEIDS